jgi:hypothetical protein
MEEYTRDIVCIVNVGQGDSRRFTSRVLEIIPRDARDSCLRFLACIMASAPVVSGSGST